MDNKLSERTIQFFKPKLIENLSYEHYRMMVIVHLSEAIESWRKSQRADVSQFKGMLQAAKEQTCMTEAWYANWFPVWYDKFVLGSVEDKLADASIRFFLYAKCALNKESNGNENIAITDTSSIKELTFVESIDNIIISLYNSPSDFYPLMYILFRRLGYTKKSDLDYLVKTKLQYLSYRGLDNHKQF